MKQVAVAIHAKENFNVKIIEELEGLDFIHVDVMDGKFVNNTNLNLTIFKILKNDIKIPIIAHLMVLNPFEYIKKIINFIDIYLFHYESNGDKYKIIQEVKKHYKEVGIVINPDTEIANIISYLDKINYVLVMSVHPGWSGQAFIQYTIDKVNKLAEYKTSYKFKIIVDGGINLENSKKLRNADILSCSSAILDSENPNFIIETLKQEYD